MLLATQVAAFIPQDAIKTPTSTQAFSNIQRSYAPHLLMSSNGGNDGRREERVLNEAAKSKGNVDVETRKKLLAESIAPWRTLRLFLYASLGSGAALGGFITLTGVLAALSGARDDVDLNTEVRFSMLMEKPETCLII